MLDRIAGSATEFRIFGRLVHPRVLQIHELSHRYQRNGVDIPVDTLPKNSRATVVPYSKNFFSLVVRRSLRFHMRKIELPCGVKKQT